MRRLVLYSDQTRPETERIEARLLEMLEKTNPVLGYIPSFGDPHRKFYLDRREYYAGYGVALAPCFEIDHAYQPERLDELLACDGIHLSGGNTYYFRYWLKQRGLDQVLKDFNADGGVLVGVSAGAILMTPGIDTARLCGDLPDSGLPSRFTNDLGGLALVDFAFLPHYTPQKFSDEFLQDYARQTGMRLYVCPDNGGIVVEGDRIELLGPVLCIHP